MNAINIFFSNLLLLLLYLQYNPNNKNMSYEYLLLNSSIISTKCFLIFSRYSPGESCSENVWSLLHIQQSTIRTFSRFYRNRIKYPDKFRMYLTGSTTSSHLLFFLSNIFIIWFCNLLHFLIKFCVLFFLLSFHLYTLFNNFLDLVYNIVSAFQFQTSSSSYFFKFLFLFL